MSRQSCAVCAWRENCKKRFCIPDGGARCPDYCHDITIKDVEEDKNKTSDSQVKETNK